MADRRVYVVIKHDWREWEWSDEEMFTRHGEAGKPVRAFTDYAKAEAFLKGKERSKRAKANPFLYGNVSLGIAEVSHFDADRFHDWLLDAGVEPPADSRGEKFTLERWSEWWKQTKKDLSESQIAKVWEATDKVRFYSILEFDEP